MKTNNIKSALVLVFTLMTATVFAGGGWIKPKGEGYFKLGQYWLIADKHYTDAGRLDPNVTTGVFITSLYGEYGFADRWEVQAYIPLLARNYTNNIKSATSGALLQSGDAINTIGDINLAAKYGLLTGRVAVAPSLLIGLPTGTMAGGEQENLQTGDGELNIYPRVDASTSWKIKGQTLYVSAYAGYNVRSNDYSDEYRLGGEIGVGLFKDRFWFNMKIDQLTSTKNGLPPSESVGTGIFANNTEYTATTFEGAAYIGKKWGVSASMSTASNAKLILAAPAYTFGVFMDLKK